ncbi:MAG: DUF4382 domain-containing protein [Planctomycetes bacterium]|nr:DUF4382 domain-containing protein [Planctomycetota bacterium]
MKFRTWLGILPAIALLSLALLPSCGSSGGGSGSLHGTLALSLTDAASDQVESFRVTVTAVDLLKSNNTTTHLLAAPVEVDLADMTDTGQLLNSIQATIGSYTQASITLDMSTASCILAGQSAAAAIEDDQGNAIAASITVPVNFPAFFSLGGNAHKLIELDLDLAQSLVIDTGNNRVQFAPSFVVRTLLAQQKPVWVAGTISSVDEPNSAFVLELLDANSTLIGFLDCTSDNATVFQTDGVPATGATGLTALAAMTVGTWVQAQGTLDPASSAILVSNVNAGVGTWNGGTDIIEGHVIDRTGGTGADATLTVLGRSSNAAHDTFQYNTTFTVSTTFAGTNVVRHASASAYDTDEINIGQQVRVFGTLAGLAMDADTGVLREQPTWIYGTAAAAPAGGQMTLSLDKVGLRDQTLFNWSADPANFVTDVGTLADALSITTGTHTLERGYFAGVGGGATDFSASNVVNADTAPALVLVRNVLATGLDVTLTCGSTQIDISVSGTAGTGELAVLDQGFVGVTDLPTSPTPNIVPAASVGLYTIRVAGSGLTVYTNFSSFSTALNTLVGGGAAVRHLAAVGTWDSGTSTLSATLTSVLVQ